MNIKRLYRICKVSIYRKFIQLGYETPAQYSQRRAKSYIKHLRRGITIGDDSIIDSNMMVFMYFVASRDVTIEKFLERYKYSDEKLMYMTCTETVGEALAFLKERIEKVQENGDYKRFISIPHNCIIL